MNRVLQVLGAGGATRHVVLRRWARADWELEDPDYTVERQARVLALLRRAAVATPEVLAADPAGERCDVPALLLSRLDGHPPGRREAERDGFCRELAEVLAMIHDNRAAEGAVPLYRLYFDRGQAAPARWMPDTSVWRREALVRQPPPATAMTLIHRDYHAENNTLWSTFPRGAATLWRAALAVLAREQWLA